MADASRFPHLALPFVLVGAAAGWLCAGLLQNPLILRVHPAPPWGVALVTAGVAGASGALHTWLCDNELPRDPQDSSLPARSFTDTWMNHGLVVLAAGAIAGALSAGVFDAYHGVVVAALGGLGCAIAFLPVCFAVLHMARRAQRARMGSLVAASDRRAVWGILLTALAVTTIGALPNWPAWLAGDTASQVPVVALLAAAAVGVAGVLGADALGLVRAKASLAHDLVAKEASEVAAAGTATPRLDLGLGDDLSAKVERTNAAYRGQDRTVALIVGTPGLALSALRGALLRGGVGLALVGAVAAAHVAATSGAVQHVYDQSACLAFDSRACERAADRLVSVEPEAAAVLYEKACSRQSPRSCNKAADIFHARTGASAAYGELQMRDPKEDARTAAALRVRGCRYGDREACVNVR